jgi:uncharacterized BrkB/YihY/UPF0761 family membrane protein
MISTITTSVVSSIATVAMAGSLALISIVTLVAMLIQKEFASPADKPTARALTRALNIGILPLVISFAVLVIFKIADELIWAFE